MTTAHLITHSLSSTLCQFWMSSIRTLLCFFFHSSTIPEGFLFLILFEDCHIIKIWSYSFPGSYALLDCSFTFYKELYTIMLKKTTTIIKKLLNSVHPVQPLGPEWCMKLLLTCLYPKDKNFFSLLKAWDINALKWKADVKQIAFLL